MKISLKYAKTKQIAEIPESHIQEIIEGNSVVNSKTEEQIIDEALANPIDSPKVSDLIHPG